jgi:hypothetical protein
LETHRYKGEWECDDCDWLEKQGGLAHFPTHHITNDTYWITMFDGMWYDNDRIDLKLQHEPLLEREEVRFNVSSTNIDSACDSYGELYYYNETQTWTGSVTSEHCNFTITFGME